MTGTQLTAPRTGTRHARPDDPSPARSPATVVVYGGSGSPADSERTLGEAAEAGRLLARAGLAIAYGGGSDGPMGACAVAAAAAGGSVTAITLAQWREPTEPAGIVITTADVLAERTAALERRADAYLVLPGGLGTRAELMSAWAGRRTGLHSRAIVVLDPDRSLHGLWLDVHQEIRAGRVPHGALGLLTTTTGAAAAVAHLIAATGR